MYPADSGSIVVNEVDVSESVPEPSNFRKSQQSLELATLSGHAKEQQFMFSETCKLQGLDGIKHLDRVGPYLIITNRSLYENSEANRYALINEAELWVHSVHGSQHAAIVFAQKHEDEVSESFLPPQPQVPDLTSPEQFYG